MVGAAATSGCSLYLDFDAAGLACDVDGRCAEGFVCNGTNECMPTGHPSTLCTPECSSLERCVRAECEAICDNRACPAGARCEDGACKMNPRNDYELGSPCQADHFCKSNVCLRPYGGGDGVCSKPCVSDVDCDGQAPLCVTFPNGAKKGRQLCVNPAFMPCENETACTASGLSCGVFAVTATTVFEPEIIEPISACRERLAGATIGAKCSSGESCANGLCVLLDDISREEICTSPCAESADCEAVLGGTGHACSPVTLNPTGAGELPRTRPMVCSKSGTSILMACPMGGCHSDAPYCVDVGRAQGLRCVTACGDSESGCPVGSVCTAQGGAAPDLCIPE